MVQQIAIFWLSKTSLQFTLSIRGMSACDQESGLCAPSNLCFYHPWDIGMRLSTWLSGPAHMVHQNLETSRSRILLLISIGCQILASLCDKNSWLGLCLAGFEFSTYFLMLIFPFILVFSLDVNFGEKSMEANNGKDLLGQQGHLIQSRSSGTVITALLARIQLKQGSGYYSVSCSVC